MTLANPTLVEPAADEYVDIDAFTPDASRCVISLGRARVEIERGVPSVPYLVLAPGQDDVVRREAIIFGPNPREAAMRSTSKLRRKSLKKKPKTTPKKTRREGAQEPKNRSTEVVLVRQRGPIYTYQTPNRRFEVEVCDPVPFVRWLMLADRTTSDTEPGAPITEEIDRAAREALSHTNADDIRAMVLGVALPFRSAFCLVIRLAHERTTQPG